MTGREYLLCVDAGCETLGQKIGFVGRLIRQAKYSGDYCRPADERREKLTRLRKLLRKLQIRISRFRG